MKIRCLFGHDWQIIEPSEEESKEYHSYFYDDSDPCMDDGWYRTPFYRAERDRVCLRCEKSELQLTHLLVQTRDWTSRAEEREARMKQVREDAEKQAVERLRRKQDREYQARRIRDQALKEES